MKAARKIDPGLVLLVLAAFLIPLMGGQVSLETVPLIGGPLSALSSLFGGAEIPTLSHLIIALLVVGAFVWLLLSRRVVQTPNGLLSASVAIFFAILVLTTAFSSFRTLSVFAATEWLVYGFGLFAVVGLAGRRHGPTAILAALFAGCAVAALKGIQEYGEDRVLDPTHRIFGGWNNPNALAAILLIGFFLGIGLTLTQERLKAPLAGVGTSFIGIALFLTGSKGAFLALGAVGVLWGVAALVLGLPPRQGSNGTPEQMEDAAPVNSRPGPPTANPRSPWWSVRAVVAIVAGVVVFAALLQFQQRAALHAAGNPGANNAEGAGTRLFSMGDSADQSAGFRKLLWQTSVDLVRTNPAGYGLGTFRFESGRPGLTTQTVFAHSTYLQLAVEGSVVLPLAFLAVMGIWLRLVLRNVRSLPSRTRTTLISVVAAIAAILVHSFVDSDVYYFGVGLSVFLLVGVGLLVAADAVAPEFLFPPVRAAAAAFGGIVLASLAYFGVVQYESAIARGELESGNVQDARDTLSLLHAIAPMDGEVWYMSAEAAPSRQDAVTAAQNAVDAAPSTRDLRLLARLQKDLGQSAAAEAAYMRALTLDPNNLTTLYQLAQLQRQNGDPAAYAKTLWRLIGVEDSVYYKVRSLPEMIPTETYQARIELADQTTDVDEKRRLLGQAVRGFREYLAKTVPNVVRMSKASPPLDFAGISLDQAREKLKLAGDAARSLAALDRARGDVAGAAKAEDDAKAFAEPI